MPKKNQNSWKKGRSGNAAGRPKLSDEIRAIRSSLKSAVFEVAELLQMTAGQLIQVECDPCTPALQLMAIRAIEQGDWKVVNSLLDRVMGKPLQDIGHSLEASDKNVYELAYKVS